MDRYYYMDLRLLPEIRKRFDYYLADAKELMPTRPFPLYSHPHQWANVLMELQSEDQLVVLFRLLAYCPNSEWVDRGVDKAITLLQNSNKIGPLLVTGIMIRNLYWLHTASKDPNRDSIDYYYMTATIMAYVWVAWEIIQNKGEPQPGAPYYYPERL